MTRRLSVLLLALALPLAGCGGHEIDEAAWKAELQEHGVPDPDIDGLRGLFVGEDGICSKDQEAMDLFVAVGRDEAGDEELTRVSIKHACPDALHKFAKARQNVDANSGRTERVCSTPRDQLSEEDRLWAEASGC